MKDWQFFLAILTLVILLLPINEGFQTKAADIPNGVYHIKCRDKFCSMEGQIVVCKKDKPELTDLFIIEKVNQSWMRTGGYSITPTQKIGIQQCADEGHRVICDRGYVNTWETFRIMDIGGGFYTINGGNHTNWDKQFCSGEGGKFLCKKTSPGDMAKFQLISPVQATCPTCPEPIKCPSPTTCPPPTKCPEPITCPPPPQCPPLSCDGEISSLSKSNSDLRGQVTQSQSQLTGLEGRLGSLQSGYTELNGQYGKMQGDVAGIESSYTGIQTEVNRINGEQIPWIQNALGEMKTNQSGLKDQLRVINDVTIPSVNSNISILYGKNDKLSELQKYYTTHGSAQDVATY